MTFCIAAGSTPLPKQTSAVARGTALANLLIPVNVLHVDVSLLTKSPAAERPPNRGHGPGHSKDTTAIEGRINILVAAPLKHQTLCRVHGLYATVRCISVQLVVFSMRSAICVHRRGAVRTAGTYTPAAASPVRASVRLVAVLSTASGAAMAAIDAARSSVVA